MEIPSSQILMLIQQFLKENNLHESLRIIQQESKVFYKSTEFIGYFTDGNYLECLRELSQTQIDPSLLVDLYEYIIKDWIEMGHVQGAKMLLTQTEPMMLMRERFSERYLDLESQLTRPKPTTELEKSIKKLKITNALKSQITEIPPNRLVTLLGQALKHQVSTNQINPNEDIDLYSSQVPETRKEMDQCVERVYKTIEFQKSSMVEALGWSPDGMWFCVGLVDGFIEIYSHVTGNHTYKQKLRTDLLYQAKGECLLQDSACLCLGFSSDSTKLVTGGQDGGVYVWELVTGNLVKRIFGHGEGVCDVNFNKKGDMVLTGSFDFTAKIHGMKTGKALKVFRGHTSYVNTCTFSSDESAVLTGSSDGTVKVFNTQTTDCISTIKLADGNVNGINLRPVHTIIKMDNDQYLVANQSGWIYFMNLSGKLLKCFEVLKKDKSQITACTRSSSGEYVYVSTDRTIYCIDSTSGELVSDINAGGNEVISMAHHPFANIVAVCDDGAKVKLYKP